MQVVVVHRLVLRNKALIMTGRGELLLLQVAGVRAQSLVIKPIALLAPIQRVLATSQWETIMILILVMIIILTNFTPTDRPLR